MSTGVDSGMSKRVDVGYTTHQGNAYQNQMQGISRLPQVEGAEPQPRGNYMHLRTNNRSGMQSLDRNRGGVGRSRGAYLPNTNSTTRKDSRLNYNSSSIPYLNKRGGPESGLASHNVAGLPIGSQEVQKRPRGYDPVGLGGTNRPSGLPSVI